MRIDHTQQVNRLPTEIPFVVRVCLLVAGLKIVIGTAGFLGFNPNRVLAPPTPFSEVILFLHVLLFGGAAVVLLYGGRDDVRARHLGAFLLMVGSSYADRFVLKFSDVPVLWTLLLPLTWLFPNSFMACFMWMFVRDFPQPTSRERVLRIFRVGFLISLICGTVFFLANVALGVAASLNNSAVQSALRIFSRWGSGSYYWLILFLLVLAALPFAMWKTRSVNVESRRRAQLFVAGLALGFGPVFGDLALELLIPPFRRIMDIPANRQLFGYIVYPFLLSVPFTTTYSVLVHRVLDVRLIVRKAMQYALARYTVLLATILPFLSLTLYIYDHRQETVVDLIAGRRPLGLLGASILGIVMLQVRQRVFNAVDKRFFREQYDARIVLSKLLDRSRQVDSPEELSRLLNQEIDTAFHLESVAVLTTRVRTGELVSLDPTRIVRSLSLSSAVAAYLESSPDAVDVDFEDAKSPLRRFPIQDKQWLVDSNAHLLFPLIGSNGALVGVLVLGAKRSELPFSKEDRLLLGAIAASSALTIENRLIRSSPAVGPLTYSSAFASVQDREPGTPDDVAMECPECRILSLPTSSNCPQCGDILRLGSVPYILNGKFRLDRRVGAGAMGVVYKASDLALGRKVAIKTLPRMSPEFSTRLRREARAMAAVTHPNLALIFGVESWLGTPMLVFEYLDGGTLASRLSQKSLTVEDALELGIVLADVLSRAHRAGILHRDIKPSNIGYTEDMIPKLLDFGLAKIIDDSRREKTARQPGQSVQSTVAGSMVSTQSSSGQWWGTPCYLSPEAVFGKPPTVGFDLWSLVMLLYESIAGRNPVIGSTVSETMVLITRGAIADIREFAPLCPESVAVFFKSALSKDLKRRPATSEQLRRELQILRQAII